MTSKDEALKNPIDMDEDGSESDDDGGFVPIYPNDQRRGCYPTEDLVDFSTKAITKYNHKKGCTYMFVELVEGLLHTTFVAKNIVTIFKARQTDGMLMTFIASTYTTASRTLSDPNIHIKVAPFLPDSGGQIFFSSDSDSDSDSDSEFEFESESGSGSEYDEPEILGAQVKLLEISS